MRSMSLALAIASMIVSAGFAEQTPLLLERKIPLGDVRGRILDHLAIDVARGRLFVAALEHDAVAVVDINQHKVLQVIAGLSKPQGLGYHAPSDALYVANGGDGTVAVLRGDDYRRLALIRLGEDADNVRVDEGGNEVLVGYGSGALAVIDPASRSKVAEIGLKTHPESFQLERGGNRIFVNDPANQAIVIIDRAAGSEVARWPTRNSSNFPMALNEQARHVVVALRNPARLAVFSMQDGAPVANVALCADADDMFIDAKRQRLYASCGEGFLDVLDARDESYRRIGHIATVTGARTSLFVPELGLIFVAAPATASEPAAVWVFGPNFASEDEMQ